jgi:hypothetical protein
MEVTELLTVQLLQCMEGVFGPFCLKVVPENCIKVREHLVDGSPGFRAILVDTGF